MLIVPKTKAIGVHSEGMDVIIETPSQINKMSWKAAFEFAKVIKAAAKKSEELAKAGQIAYDQAILHRSGLQIGLTNNKMIQDEAKKIAANDSVLRRNIPLSAEVQSREIVGTPKIIKHKPK